DDDEDGYRPHFVHSNCGNIPSNAAGSSSNTQEDPSDSQDVVAILFEMRKNNNFWEGFSVEVEEYGVVQTQLETQGTGENKPKDDSESRSIHEDIDSTYIDSEVDVHDSSRTWTTTDELETMSMYESMPTLEHFSIHGNVPHPESNFPSQSNVPQQAGNAPSQANTPQQHENIPSEENTPQQAWQYSIPRK
ncbi:hypothetical protein FRX31_019909, partial [Thalictrum thalictroides]